MMRKFKTCFIYLLLGLGFYSLDLNSFLHAQSLSIESRFSPSVMQEGRQARYEVQIWGVMNASIKGELPFVSGLTIDSNGSQSRGLNRINGKNSPYVLYSFGVVAAQKGSYQTPEWKLEIDGQKYTVPSANLNVVAQEDLYKELAFLELELPDTSIYVGQLFPINVKLYVLSDVTLKGLGTFEKLSDAFIQDTVEKPKESFEQKNGKRYRMIYSSIRLNALKSGVQSIDYNVQLRAILPGDSNRNLNMFSPFEDFSSFFDNARGELIEVSASAALNILPLPQKNQPASFSGGVGFFSLKTAASNTSLPLGDAVSLQIIVEGQGNFDSITAPVFPEKTELKIYPPKRIEEADSEAIIFEYTIIPESEQVNQIPPAAFSYFDPQLKRYETITTKPVPIAVTGGNIVPSQLSKTDSSLRSSTEKALAEKKQKTVTSKEDKSMNDEKSIPFHFKPNLLDISIAPGAIRPIFMHPRFIITQFICFLFIVGIVLLLKRLSQMNTTDYRKQIEAKEVARHYLSQAHEAALKDQPELFFAAAQKSIQVVIAQDTRFAFHPFSIDDLESVLPRHRDKDKWVKTLQSFWSKAEIVKFSADKTNRYALQEEHEKLQYLIRQFKK